jgi:hypothetical protein
MDTPTKKKKLWLRFIELPLILVFVAYVVPAAKHALFPDQMTRIEKMLRCTTMEGCHLAVDRRSETKIILTVYNGAQSITSEIYKNALHELEPSGGTRTFFTYSVNRDSNEVFYLTRTRIEADADLKRVRRLEVGVCGRLVDQHVGVTRHEGYKPVYACEVPEREAVCLAADSATELK